VPKGLAGFGVVGGGRNQVGFDLGADEIVDLFEDQAHFFEERAAFLEVSRFFGFLAESTQLRGQFLKSFFDHPAPFAKSLRVQKLAIQSARRTRDAFTCRLWKTIGWL
jgi:hypothetical protein